MITQIRTAVLAKQAHQRAFATFFNLGVNNVQRHGPNCRMNPSVFYGSGGSRMFSTNENKNEEKQSKTTSDLRDTVNRLKSEAGKTDSESESTEANKEGSSSSSSLNSIQGFFSSFSSGVAEAWKELLDSGSPKGINKRIGGNKPKAPKPVEDYDGPTDIMIIDESEHLGAWEKMQRRLSEAPIIQGKHS